MWSSRSSTMSIGFGGLGPRRDFSLRLCCCFENCGFKVKVLWSMGEAAREEHSDPERRSPAVSRLLSMTSKAADLLRGCGLEVLASILTRKLAVAAFLCFSGSMILEGCIGDGNASFAVSIALSTIAGVTMKAVCHRLYTAAGRLHRYCASAAHYRSNNHDHDIAPSFDVSIATPYAAIARPRRRSPWQCLGHTMHDD